MALLSGTRMLRISSVLDTFGGGGSKKSQTPNCTCVIRTVVSWPNHAILASYGSEFGVEVSGARFLEFPAAHLTAHGRSTQGSPPGERWVATFLTMMKTMPEMA